MDARCWEGEFGNMIRIQTRQLLLKNKWVDPTKTGITELE
jgi:hypothetical protein